MYYYIPFHHHTLTQPIIDGYFAEFVLEDAYLPLCLFLQNVIDECRLAGTQKASNDCDGCLLVIVIVGSSVGHDYSEMVMVMVICCNSE